ncbi:UDP-N-acetylglucosamine 2-epimerase (non-hydrolyzing) [Sphingomonas jinjuensis]|uniref:UDP-N-acetylglucosamine 2-epimerase (non-hydrolyzing) n=1 Tax=Sphingomonas jinjuensis TaxID=535907 RepID=A0A840FAS9_9SPHN|nr:UDP-N-acetylglucosamine 2-epimerase (non-hydrolyzing) [Sphingomonas jinjuensis]MBB4155130.1 UDP-N-acetylglucosamine 2-epimerase (non-hydrolyzing) [Sphingomonas jinjuensis]
MPRLLVIIGTRPEAIKLFPVVAALRALPGMTVRLCATGQHREMVDAVLEVAGLAPDIQLAVMQPGQSLDQLVARLLISIGDVLGSEQPDRVIVQGDTATAMAGALAAYHRRIPVAHVEAGLRSGDIQQPWPEEANRRVISTMADLHFAPTALAALALAAENVTAGVHVTGNSVIDALYWTQRRIGAVPALTATIDARLAPLAGRRLILVTAHRRENIGEAMGAIARTLRRLAIRRDVAIVLPVHPNPAVVDAMERLLPSSDTILRLPPLAYPELVHVLARSTIVLTDSGGLQEEAPALGKPVLVMRETTERPEGIAAGTARLVGTEEDVIVAEACRLLDDPLAYAAMARAHNPFGDGLASARIAAILAAAHGLDTGPAVIAASPIDPEG